MYQFYIDNVLYPIPPKKFQVKINNKNETITLINTGEVNRLKSPGLTDISVSELLIPSVEYPFANYGEAGFQSPNVYLSQLENLKAQKKTFKVVLIRMINGRDLGWTTSMLCTLEDYTAEESADDGVDVKLSINFKQWVNYGTKKVTFKKTSKGAKKKTTSSRSKKTNKAKYYTVKKGDTLKGIAKKKLGDASSWKDIYKLNKSTIEKAAKKHGRKSSSNGRWIYFGTKLKLPTIYKSLKATKK